MSNESGSDVQSSDESSEIWNLRLYVAGQTSKSLEAFANLKEICETHLKGKYIIEVVESGPNTRIS